MRRIKGRSIHRTQMYAHLTTMLVSLAVVAAVFLWWQTGMMREDLESSLEQTARTVALNVDMELQRMDSLSINILYSNLVKESMAGDVATYPAIDRSTLVDARRANNAERLSNMLIAIMGADRPVRQINLYNRTGGCFGTGLYNGFYDRDVRTLDWYEEAQRLNGHRYITLPGENEMLSRSRSGSNTLFISLVRQYFDTYNQPQGFVEIIQSYDVAFAAAAVPESVYRPEIYIFNGAGDCVFPYSQAGEGGHYYTAGGHGVRELHNPDTGALELVATGVMDHTGFTVAAVLDSAQYYSRIQEFTVVALLVFAAVTALFCVVIYYTTRRISSPLLEICDILSTADFENDGWRKKLPIKKSGIWEIDVLRASINQFQRQLKKSTDKLMLLQKQELQSQMLALQSQMNPHFLYNSLSTISAMAEEGLNDEIGDMCKNITAILRYISSGGQPFVRLEEEMETCSIYLSSLKLRFGDALGYSFRIPDEMLELLVPKLAIQLLLENAAKYTVSNQPPWRIEVTGAIDGDAWTIEIRDNGPGFSEEVAGELRAKMAEIGGDGLMPQLRLGGMGLMNVYVRLHLLYGKNFQFDFSNRPEGGAAVLIGGKVLYEDPTL